MKHEAFYTTVAQVIPVVFIILAFQTGYFTFTPATSHGKTRSAGFAVYRLGVVLALASAEFLALSTLEHAHDGGSAARDFMLLTIFFAGIEVVAPYVRAPSGLFNANVLVSTRKWLTAAIVLVALGWFIYLAVR
jgi:hypothetical protein